MSTAFPHPTASVRLASGSAAALLLCLGLVGCQPEPVPGPSPSASASASASATASPIATPTPTESPRAAAEIDLPTACEQLYSATMLASLQQRGPLNDPGGSGSLAHVSLRNVADVVHAAEACPGECIFIEIDPPVDADLDVEVDGRIAARVDLRSDAA